MSTQTLSEALFEEFCSVNGIVYARVPTSDRRTPDYDLNIAGQTVVAEIKQINPNKEEQEQQRQFESRGFAVGGGTPGKRIRKVIDAAAGQIRNRAKGLFPSLVVVYNNVPLFNHTDPYFILVGMYGLETYQLRLSKQVEKKPFLLGKRFGPERRMTISDNTSISALAVMTRGYDRQITLTLYHNAHAAIPIPPDLFRPFSIKQFSLAKKVMQHFYEWEEV